MSSSKGVSSFFDLREIDLHQSYLLVAPVTHVKASHGPRSADQSIDHFLTGIFWKLDRHLPTRD